MREQGYLAAAVGATGGAAILGLPAALLAATLDCDSNGFECLGVGLLIFALAGAGGLIGAALGCYLAVRTRGHEGAFATCVFLIALLVPLSMVLSALTSLVEQVASYVAGPVDAFFALVTLAGWPLGARRLALWWLGRRPSTFTALS